MGEKEEDKDQKIAELERKLADREREIRQLLRRIERLERKNEALSRAAKRQAAPFSRGKLKVDPAKRGRKPGRRYGKRASRAVPTTVDRVVRVPAPMYCQHARSQRNWSGSSGSGKPTFHFKMRRPPSSSSTLLDARTVGDNCERVMSNRPRLRWERRQSRSARGRRHSPQS